MLNKGIVSQSIKRMSCRVKEKSSKREGERQRKVRCKRRKGRDARRKERDTYTFQISGKHLEPRHPRTPVVSPM